MVLCTCQIIHYFFLVKPIYLSLSSEIISVERYAFRGGWGGFMGHPITTTTLLHNDRCTVDLSLYNLGSDCAVPALYICTMCLTLLNSSITLMAIQVLHYTNCSRYTMVSFTQRLGSCLSNLPQAHFIHTAQGSSLFCAT